MVMHPGVRGLARAQSSRLVSERRTLSHSHRKPANIPQHAESTPNQSKTRIKLLSLLVMVSNQECTRSWLNDLPCNTMIMEIQDCYHGQIKILFFKLLIHCGQFLFTSRVSLRHNLYLNFLLLLFISLSPKTYFPFVISLNKLNVILE